MHLAPHVLPDPVPWEHISFMSIQRYFGDGKAGIIFYFVHF